MRILRQPPRAVCYSFASADNGTTVPGRRDAGRRLRRCFFSVESGKRGGKSRRLRPRSTSASADVATIVDEASTRQFLIALRALDLPRHLWSVSSRTTRAGTPAASVRGGTIMPALTNAIAADDRPIRR